MILRNFYRHITEYKKICFREEKYFAYIKNYVMCTSLIYLEY